jgi:hypothetical protein
MRASNLASATTLVLTIAAGCAGGLDTTAPRPDLGLPASPTRIELADGGAASEGALPSDDALAAPDATAPAPAPGCADGTREGFLDGGTHPEIAGCSGGWSIPGILLPGGTRCGRTAGNTGSNPAGTGCAVDDLCAAGWHVCATAAEIASRSRTGCKEAVPPSAGEPLFFASRQSGPGYSQCGPGSNDVFGCGDLGGPPAPSCAPLDAYGNDHCGLLASPWACSGGAGGVLEALTVTKSGPAKGGVLCCRD